jgi:hypothetical protein
MGTAVKAKPCGCYRTMGRKELARVVPFALLLFASSAMALDTTKLGQFGSLGLDEMTSLIDKSSQLKREVTDAVAKAKVKADEIRCDGMRFPGQWRNLGGERTAPYACKIGDKWLEVRATVRVTGRGGKSFEKITPEAMKSATTVTETNPTWKWTDQEPPSR